MYSLFQTWKWKVIFSLTFSSFFLKIFFSHIMYPDYCFHFYSYQFLPRLPCQPSVLFFFISLEKNRLRDNKTKYHKIKQKPSHRCWTRQIKRRKSSPNKGTWIRDSLVHIPGSPIEILNWEKAIINVWRMWCWTTSVLGLLFQSLLVHMSSMQLI